jgi:hypothetical protein
MGQPERNLKIKVLLCIPGRHVGNESYGFLTWPLDGGEWSASLCSPTTLLPGKEPLELVLALCSREKSVVPARNETMISWFSTHSIVTILTTLGHLLAIYLTYGKMCCFYLNPL